MPKGTRLLTSEELAAAMRDYPRPLHQRRLLPLALLAVFCGAALGVLIALDPLALLSACVAQAGGAQ
jgi:ferric-dicitrate binding protein FerR (iron transport regulator)